MKKRKTPDTVLKFSFLDSFKSRIICFQLRRMNPKDTFRMCCLKYLSEITVCSTVDYHVEYLILNLLFS